ncbi:MAG: hypothetical protein A2086_10890 [Spirochaetes bacterium GWD1_27_9]|nr:MAG: hypothetical protein A2Z98_09965 [Spirochaetes bacterium GWB1_27_13]OHD35062.1 MAG: hypothetical protein A2086_10890 [Spirochaetes bacterium GWD1_27_9]
MNKLFFFLLALFFFACTNTNTYQYFNTNLIEKDKILYLDIILNFEIPEKLQSNLKMFSYANIKIKFQVLNNKNKVISIKTIDRVIKYDRWNKIYIIKDSFSFIEKKYDNFISMKNDLYSFNNIPIQLDNLDEVKNNLIIKYDFFLKSVDFLPPFKFIEYNIKFGNIEKKNNIIVIKID